MIAVERSVLVLLAAGRSERFGDVGSKLDQPFLARPLGLHVAVALEDMPFQQRIAIVDGASAPSDHANGIWAMDEIDDLLEIEGAAEAMAELRRRFGTEIRKLLVAEARRLVGIEEDASLRSRRSNLSHLVDRGDDALDQCSALQSDEVDGFGPASGHPPSGGWIGKHFRSASPPIPRSIRFGFAKARLGA